MAETTSPSAEARAAEARFDGWEQALHWSTAVLVLVLLATAAALYIDPLSTWVGRRATVRDVHVLAGLALPVPWLVATAVRSPGFVADRRELSRWTAADRRWRKTGKFHPLQKVAAAFVVGSVPVMLGTGAIMRWFDPFPLSWRQGATFVHDWLAVGLFVFVVLHLVQALRHPAAVRAMWPALGRWPSTGRGRR